MEAIKATGANTTPKFECINPKRDIWKVRFNYEDAENDNSTFYELEYKGKPSFETIKEDITTFYNQQVDSKILSGFKWKDMTVWLSTENQFNYKAIYDLAVQTSGTTLPITFKFGTDTEPIYYTFKELSDLADFYTQVLTYIQTTLSEGWTVKDKITEEDYKL